MKMSSSYFGGSSNSCMILLVVILHIMSWCEGAPKLPPNVTIPAVFAFGDSIVDQGNNNAMITLAKANFPPNGKDFRGGVATGRFCNGRTPIDFFAQELGIKELVPAYLDPNLKDEDLQTGVSFASAGSGFDPQSSVLMLGIPLSAQLELFKQYIGKLKAAVGEEKGNQILSNSLYLVVSGTNDIGNTYFTFGLGRLQGIASYTDHMTSSASAFVQELYKLGARRIGVSGVPPIGCVPFQRTLKGGLMRVCSEEVNEASKLFNSKLSLTVDSLAKSLPQSRVVYIDIYNSLVDLVQYPQNYGFEVSDKGCCGAGYIELIELCNRLSGTCDDSSKYVFWDSYHPTEKAYKVIVDQIIEKYVNLFA